MTSDFEQVITERINQILSLKKEYARLEMKKFIMENFEFKQRGTNSSRAAVNICSVQLDHDIVVKVVCERFGCTFEQIIGKTRQREVVLPRQFLMTLLAKHTHLSLKAIGTMCGNRDHTTVIHARNTIRDLIETDDKVAQEFEFLDNKINQLRTMLAA